jgi:hypothetical protein
VDIAAKKCACYKWDLTGIPCKHAVSAIAHKKHIPEEYVADYFKVETYHRVYSHLIEPTNGEELWPRVVGNKVLPLDMRKQPDRPKKKKKNQRKKDADEPINPHKLRKSAAPQKCGKCGQFSHKKRSCNVDVGQTFGAQFSIAQTSTAGFKKKGGKRKSTETVFMGFRVAYDVESVSVSYHLVINI